MKPFEIRKPLVQGVMLLCAAALASNAGAQESRTAAKSLEFRTDLPWSLLVLKGDAKISGVSPLRVPGPATGDYWLIAEGRGFEKQRGRVSIRLDEEGSRIVGQGALPPQQNFMRSLLFPGYAQFRYGEAGRGILMTAAAVASLVFIVEAQDDLWEEGDEKDAIESELARTTNSADRTRLQNDLREAEEEESLARAERNLFLFSTAGVWGVSMVDAMLFSPRFDVSAANESTIEIEMRTRSRSAALVRSAVFPGLGQQYNGHSTKAIFIAAGGVLGSAFFLWQQQDYLQAQSAFDQISVRAANTAPGEDRNRLFREAAELGVERQSERRDRNWAMVALGAYWGLSLLDTALSFEERWGDVPVGEGWRFGFQTFGDGAGVLASHQF
jgi:hypothetical protein